MSDPAFARVAVPIPVRRLFTYRVPETQRARMLVGRRVGVPFGPRRIHGTVVEWPAPHPGDDVEIRDIAAIPLDGPCLPGELLALTRFVADYYLCSWGEAIDSALPPGGRFLQRRPCVRRLPAADPAGLSSRAVLQRELLERLPPDGQALPVARLTAAQRRAIPALLRRGWVERFLDAGDLAAAPPPLSVPPDPFPLSAGQLAAVAEIEPAVAAAEFAAFLLFGATGSGKTEVYFRAVRAALSRGRGVIYLVPEIGLTPLLLEKVHERFPGQAAVLHSGLAAGQRRRAWEQLSAGSLRLVVGTRSAIFAPVRELGLIVVDEEQDGSYKQGETPRYNARDLAVWRAREASGVVLMGSATPAMESFHHARAGRYRLLRLGGRVVSRPLPEVLLVDMREEYRRRGIVTPISETLRTALEDCLSRGEQALVLRNRRGWAAAVICPRCGERVGCQRCSLALTWHRAEARLRCHTCMFETGYPQSCPTCGHEDLNLLGEGSEQVEDGLRRALPQARLERMDRDTLRSRGAHEAMLMRFARREIDVLVGTQMIAKGHDFPNVTLVGVIAADHALGLPDFRAGERTFQLLTQVAGRAGRGQRPGRVVAQAFHPEHPLLQLAVAQDYETFFDREIEYRRALRYPPVTALVQILVLDREEHRARAWAERVAMAVRSVGGPRLLLAGPGPAPVPRIKGRFRQQILIRTAGRRRLVAAVDQALTEIEGEVPRRALVVDVDPTSVL